MQHKILLVEDDVSLGFLLMEYLESEGFEVKLARDGQTGWQFYQKGSFDLCILDVMMPRIDGFELARRIRSRDRDVPFVFLTAKSMKVDKLEAFSIGAEDYITKPFDEEVLLCRIQVILRRNQAKQQPVTCLPTVFQIGDYQFDSTMQELTLGSQTVRITEKENAVLRLLCLNKGKILRRDEAVEQIYGKKDYFLGRSFDVFISRCRKLLKEDPRIQIENVFRVGFILKVPDNQPITSI